jgi:hypothetical protein
VIALFFRPRGNDKTDGKDDRLLSDSSSCRERRSSRRLIAILLGSFALAGFSHASVVAQVNVRVETISGGPVSGRLTRLTDSRLELKSDAGGTNVNDLKDVLAVSATDFDDVKVPPVSKTPWIFLSTGDRLRMTPLVIDDESIAAQWDSFSLLPPISLPLELCRGIVMSVPSSARQQGRSFDRLLNHQHEVDLITLSNGDRIEGEFVSLKDEQFTLDTSIGEVQTGTSQTQSLVFNPDLVSIPEADENFAVLVLSDGSTLHVRSISSDGDLIIAESTGGFEFSIPVTALRTIRLYETDKIDLTGRQPTATTVVPYLSMARQPQANRNVIGGFLSLRGRLAPTGFGVTSGTTQTWNLSSGYSQFRATVGIDDAAQGAGSVIFKVLVDDSVAWESDLLTGKSPAVKVPPIDLSSADRLSLVVETADRGNVLDYANWCEPVLIRKPADAARQ